VDDCSTEAFEDVVEKFKPLINVEIIHAPVNAGPGVARQIGIDNSKADYLMFIDSDDILSTPNAVTTCVKLAKDNNADIVVCDFNEEMNGGFYTHIKDQTFMHGKMYRTAFLKENDIRFNESRTNEDGVFNAIAITLSKGTVFYGQPIYQWCNNVNSTVRSCDYLGGFIHTFVLNAKHAYSELYKRKVADDLLCALVMKYATTMYGYYLDFIHQYDQEYLDKYLNYVKDFMDNTHFFAYYHRTTRDTLKKLVSTNEIVKQNIQPSSMQFDELVEMINKL
jgi:glycosyltransferase involved in cell wall biosynthesis